jgi:hypothetical protein
MARGRLGRPPLPEDERKRTITVYLGMRVVDSIDHRAAREGLSRNQLIAAILADHFAPGDGLAARGEDPTTRDGTRRAAPELPGARP